MVNYSFMQTGKIMINKIIDFFKKNKSKKQTKSAFERAILIIQSFQLEYMSEYADISISACSENHATVFVHTDEQVVLYLTLNEKGGYLDVGVNKIVNDNRLIGLLALINNQKNNYGNKYRTYV